MPASASTYSCTAAHSPRLQHDDSILSTTYNAITSALDGKKSANGCPVRGGTASGMLGKGNARRTGLR